MLVQTLAEGRVTGCWFGIPLQGSWNLALTFSRPLVRSAARVRCNQSGMQSGLMVSAVQGELSCPSQPKELNRFRPRQSALAITPSTARTIRVRPP